MDAAGEDARLGRCAVAAGPADRAHVDVPAHDVEQTPAGLVAAGHAHRNRRAAECRDIARRIAGAAGDDVRRVVVEDEDGRLPRDAGELAVDEFVDDEVAENRDSQIGKAVDERQQAAGIDGVSQRGTRTAFGHDC